MAIPDFLAELRSMVGTRLLWLPAATAVVIDDEGRLLLNRRTDDGKWSLIGGILDPGEQPAHGVVRECYEEAGIVVEPDKLVMVDVSPQITYPSGDLCQYLDVVFRCHPISGQAQVHDDESLAVEWFTPSNLPPVDAYTSRRIDGALYNSNETAYYTR
ncbi:NUDIX hydrolase [Nocardia transvalensis]|uniref:NUDIX hydrolase n=1 Tax=Nocardia transvalensis TaxID=37333 RepID=UPI001892D57B|nr:NUDIX domain-containing protein [Nocardia transvalensis]MBF6331101.1 NUDIX domain-containing protein [Nocardia transvalensis]